MRPLRALTVRGRAFVAAGLTAVLCAFAAGEHALLSVGLLLIVCPCIAALVVSRAQLTLRARRQVQPAEVAVDVPATVTLSLSNHGRMPAGVILLEDRIGDRLGRSPRFVLDRVSPRWRRDLTYTVRSELRGRYEVGPLELTVADPFGLVQTRHAFPQVHRLLVTPTVHDLTTLRPAADHHGSGETRLRALAAVGEEDVTVREYRAGDDLRRVHWRASAHAGELMVRREERPWQRSCHVLIDARRRVHAGVGARSSLEWAVSAAASVGVDAINRGYRTRLFGGPRSIELIRSGLRTPPAPAIGVRDLVAEATMIAPHAAEGLGGLAELAGGLEPSYAVAIVGACSPADLIALNRWRSSRGSAIAMVIDAASWRTQDADDDPEIDTDHPGHRRLGPTDPPMAPGAVELTVGELRNAGWRVLPVRRDDDLRRLWAALTAATDSAGVAGRVGSV